MPAMSKFRFIIRTFIMSDKQLELKESLWQFFGIKDNLISSTRWTLLDPWFTILHKPSCSGRQPSWRLSGGILRVHVYTCRASNIPYGAQSWRIWTLEWTSKSQCKSIQREKQPKDFKGYPTPFLRVLKYRNQPSNTSAYVLFIFTWGSRYIVMYQCRISRCHDCACDVWYFVY